MTRAVFVWGPAALWAAVLFFLSSLQEPPGGGISLLIPGGDKLGHFLLYGILGALLARGRVVEDGVPHGLLITLGVLYGASDEWHQSFVPGRQVSAIDWLADLCGVVAGYAIAFSLLRRRALRAVGGDAAG